jgi:2-polyprenyl-3-methyl-5-hydroxy-6-metoxy-1,4-benzoquinol methylase
MNEQVGTQAVGEQGVASGRPFPTNEANLQPSAEMARRWRSETEFFDLLASRLRQQARPMSAEELERYRQGKHPWFCKEYRIKLLGDLRGKRILDLACGEGSNSIIFASLGATVTGFDISPQSVELAAHRAKINGVAERASFFCASAEEITFPEGSFDIVWGDGVLHHLIPVLDVVLGKAARWVRPGGRAVFSEPVCLSAALRALRRHVPVHTDATPDERPLQRPEMEIIRKHLPDVKLRWFNLFARFQRFVLAPPLNYERSSTAGRLAAHAMGLMDWAVLSLPGICELGGTVAMTGTFRR